MAEMKVFVINLDEQEKDTGCAWFTLPCNIEALKQSIGLPPEYVTVSINEEFVPSEQVESTVLKDGDNVEFLYFMGGGSYGVNR